MQEHTAQALRDLADAVEAGDIPETLTVVDHASHFAFTRPRFVQMARMVGAERVERRGSKIVATRDLGASSVQVKAEARDLVDAPPLERLAEDLAAELGIDHEAVAR